MRARIATALLLCCVGLASGQDGAPSVRLLDAGNVPIDERNDALEVSRSITNNGTLPSGFDYETHSRDEDDVRIEVSDPGAHDNEVWASIESLDGASQAQRSVLRVALQRPRVGLPFRSRFVRLVGDQVDLHAPSVEAQTLLVALRDVVRVSYESASGTVTQTLRVGAPGASRGPRAARRARLQVHVLRSAPGAPPVAGTDETSALRLVQAQVRVANEIWLQCNLTFGEPNEVPIEIVAPPPPSMIAVADGDGLPARGNGIVRFVVDGKHVGPITTRAEASPLQTAQEIARGLLALGYSPRVTENARTRFGAGKSADILVARRDGSLATVAAQDSEPLTTDVRQRVTIGVVDLLDGLSEFDNMNAQAGTLEERALVKALADDDPGSIDLFIVNRFADATRQGEAFIAKSADAGASIVNTVILDRQGLRQAPLAWTLAHELGHVLMDDPLHPDNIGPDRPWLLMDADNSRGTVNGPKRLRADECARMRERAAVARAPLLVPYDVVAAPPPTAAGSK